MCGATVAGGWRRAPVRHAKRPEVGASWWFLGDITVAKYRFVRLTTSCVSASAQRYLAAARERAGFNMAVTGGYWRWLFFFFDSQRYLAAARERAGGSTVTGGYWWLLRVTLLLLRQPRGTDLAARERARGRSK